MPWRKKRLPTPAFWAGEFHRLYSPWGRKESDTTERLSLSCAAIIYGVEGPEPLPPAMPAEPQEQQTASALRSLGQSLPESSQRPLRLSPCVPQSRVVDTGTQAGQMGSHAQGTLLGSLELGGVVTGIQSPTPDPPGTGAFQKRDGPWKGTPAACDPEGYPTEPRIAGETTESSFYKAALTWMAREHPEGSSPGARQPRMDVPWLLSCTGCLKKGWPAAFSQDKDHRSTGPAVPRLCNQL